MPAKSAQSVTEYLSTYSWAILAASAVVIVMFALGVFNSPIPIQSCILVPGYICSHPILTDSGILSFNLSYVGQTITVTGIGCNSGNLPPASLQSANFVLTSNKGRSVTVACPISSNAFGTGFQGHLWLQYNTQTQSNLESDIGVILGAVNTRTSTSTTSTSTTSTSSTSSTTTSSTSTTSSSSTSSSSTSTTTTTSTSTTSSSSTTSTSTSTTTSSTTTIPTQNPTCGYFLGDAVYSSSVTLTCNVITSNAMLIQSGVTVDENGFYMQANSLFTNYGTITDGHDGGNGGTGGSGGSGGPGTASAGSGGNSGSARTSKYLGHALTGGAGGAGGGGGGGGASFDIMVGGAGGTGGNGGSGGGIVEIYSSVFNNLGTISVNGNPGAVGGAGHAGTVANTNPPHSNYGNNQIGGGGGGGGAGQGGAGGTIFIGYGSLLNQGTLQYSSGSTGSIGAGASGGGEVFGCYFASGIYCVSSNGGNGGSNAGGGGGGGYVYEGYQSGGTVGTVQGGPGKAGGTGAAGGIGGYLDNQGAGHNGADGNNGAAGANGQAILQSGWTP